MERVNGAREQQTANTRQRDSSSRSPSPGTTKKNLPPPRRGQPIRTDVSLPFEHTRLSKFVYILVALTALSTAFYGYRILQHKNEAGGWWNLALGRRPPVGQSTYETAGLQGHGKASEHGVEEKINQLAEALGMPSRELASAIALAVRNYVPPASLSSVAAKESGTIVKVIVEGAEAKENSGASISSPTPTSGVVGGVVEGIEKGFDNFVGFEEP